MGGGGWVDGGRLGEGTGASYRWIRQDDRRGRGRILEAAVFLAQPVAPVMVRVRLPAGGQAQHVEPAGEAGTA